MIRGAVRWSVVKSLAVAASMTGEPGKGGMVGVGPPKSPSGASRGSPVVKLSLPVNGPAKLPATMVFDISTGTVEEIPPPTVAAEFLVKVLCFTVSVM